MFNPKSLKTYLNFWCSALDVKPDSYCSVMKVKMFDSSLRKFYFTCRQDLDKAIHYLSTNNVEFSYQYWSW